MAELVNQGCCDKHYNGLSVVSQRQKKHVLKDNRESSRQLRKQDLKPNQPQPLQRNNTGLPDNLKSGMENLSGMSLDHVKVHYNSAKPATVQAHAFAQGGDIHLASGQERHLPHELGHVVQQAQGRVNATTSVGGIAVNDNVGLESEATRMGDLALQRTISKDEVDLVKPMIQNPMIQGKWRYNRDLMDFDGEPIYRDPVAFGLYDQEAQELKKSDGDSGTILNKIQQDKPVLQDKQKSSIQKMQRRIFPVNRSEILSGKNTIQLFTDDQVRVKAQQLSERSGGEAEDNWLSAKQQIIAMEFPEEDAEKIMRMSWEIKQRYEGGEEISKEEYNLMGKGLSDEEILAAAKIKRETMSDMPSVPEYVDGKRDWASSEMNQALNTLRKQLSVMDTGHHKVSKSYLTQIVGFMTPEQDREAREILDLSLSGTSTYRSLGSNLTPGVNSGSRVDEHGRALDSNRFSDGSMTPRSAIYKQINGLLLEIIGKRSEQQDKARLSKAEFGPLIGMLEDVERYHYSKTQGQLLDSDTSMWLEIPVSAGKPSLWKKGAVAPREVKLADKETPIRLLKLPKYQAARGEKTKTHSVPEIFSGSTIPIEGGYRERSKTLRHLDNKVGPLASTQESILSNRATWASSGYRTITTDYSESYYEVERSRVDPEELIAAVTVAFKSMGKATSLILENIISLILKIESINENKKPRENASLYEFDKVENVYIGKFKAINRQIELLMAPTPESKEIFSHGKKQAKEIIWIILIFLEGLQKEYGAELADGYEHLF